MYINGEWVSRNNLQEVINPFDNSVIDTVPSASVEDVSLAVDSAERGFQAMKKISSWDRYSMLMKAADLIEERKEDQRTKNNYSCNDFLNNIYGNYRSFPRTHNTIYRICNSSNKPSSYTVVVVNLTRFSRLFFA